MVLSALLSSQKFFHVEKCAYLCTMKATKETYIAAALFAAENGFENITYAGIYKGAVAYYATNDSMDGACTGYPHYVLVSSGKNGVECSYATPDEVLEIIDLQN